MTPTTYSAWTGAHRGVLGLVVAAMLPGFLAGSHPLPEAAATTWA
jgi:hypothetical protein